MSPRHPAVRVPELTNLIWYIDGLQQLRSLEFEETEHAAVGTGLKTDQQAWRLVHVVPCLSDTGDDGVCIAGDRAEAPCCDTLTGCRADHLQGAAPRDPRMAAILKTKYKIYL